MRQTRMDLTLNMHSRARLHTRVRTRSRPRSRPCALSAYANRGAHPFHICSGTRLAPATSAPGLGSPLPHLRRDSARRALRRLGQATRWALRHSEYMRLAGGSWGEPSERHATAADERRASVFATCCAALQHVCTALQHVALCRRRRIGGPPLLQHVALCCNVLRSVEVGETAEEAFLRCAAGRSCLARWCLCRRSMGGGAKSIRARSCATYSCFWP